MRIIYAGVGRLSGKDPLDQAAQDYADRLAQLAYQEGLGEGG